jgi:hypothetical protein
MWMNEVDNSSISHFKNLRDCNATLSSFSLSWFYIASLLLAVKTNKFCVMNICQNKLILKF